MHLIGVLPAKRGLAPGILCEHVSVGHASFFPASRLKSPVDEQILFGALHNVLAHVFPAIARLQLTSHTHIVINELEQVGRIRKVAALLHQTHDGPIHEQSVTRIRHAARVAPELGVLPVV